MVRGDIEQGAVKCEVSALPLGCLPVQDTEGHVLVGINEVHPSVSEPTWQTQPCQVLANVYTFPQLLSPVENSRPACLVCLIAQQIRLALPSGWMRYVVPCCKAHLPNERLEIDLSFLYHLRRDPISFVLKDSVLLSSTVSRSSPRGAYHAG